MKINNYTISGLFKAGNTPLQLVNVDTNRVALNAELADCREPAFVMIDLSSAVSDGFNMSFISSDGTNKTDVALKTSSFNIIPITALGYIKEDGSIDFELWNDSITTFTALGIKVGIIAYSAVINH